MTKGINLDYRKCDIEDVDSALHKIVDKEIDSIRINNIHPAVFEDRYDMEIDDENGFDMDWWGTISYFNGRPVKIPVFGCCRYGYIQIKRED